MLLLEGDIAGRILGLAEDLDLDALGADVVEDELGASSTLGVDSARNADLGLLLLLALLEAVVLLEEIAQIDGDLELVGIRVWVLGLTELVDLVAADFEVLLSSMIKD